MVRSGPTGGQLSGRSMLAQVEVSLHFGLSSMDLEALGIDRSSLSGPEVMVPAAMVYAHLEAVEARGNFGPFAVAVAQAHSLSAMGPVGFTLKAASTVREALRALDRFQSLTQTVAHFEIVERPPVAYWREQRHGPPTLGQRLATEVTVLITAVAARALVPDFRPRWAHVRRSDAPVALYRQFLGCGVESGRPEGQLGFDAQYLDARPPGGDPELHAFLHGLLEGLEEARLERQRPTTVVQQILGALPARLSQGETRLSDVARALKVGTRTLQRRLSDEGLSFSALLDEQRHALAREYLRDRTLSAAEVAYLLGYEEPTSFFRAFRRWTGQTPEGYRAQGEAQGSSVKRKARSSG